MCRNHALKPHCRRDSTVCDWVRCGNCKATLDLKGRRGYDLNGAVTF